MFFPTDITHLRFTRSRELDVAAESRITAAADALPAMRRVA